MTTDELRALIATDAEATAFASLGNDAGCAARCSMIAPLVQQPIPAEEIQRFASESRIWGTMAVAARKDSVPDAVRGLCLTFLDWVQGKGQSIDLSRPAVQGIVDSFVAAGMITSDQKIALYALAMVNQVITPAQFSEAR